MMNNIQQEMYDDLYLFLKERSDSKNKSDYYSNGIHCSSLDSCVRQVVMDYFKFPKKDLTLAELLMFEIANFLHRLMGDWAKASNIFELIGEEQILTDYLPGDMSGKCDLNIRHKASGTKILTDTKTAMPLAFKKYADWLVKDSHKIQINSYNYGLKKKEQEADDLALTYFDRGGTNNPVYVSIDKMSDSEIEAIFAKYQSAVDEYKEKKKLPDKEPLIFEVKSKTVYVKHSWKCSYCKFCNISCEGYPDFDRKKAVRIGTIVEDELYIDRKFYHIQNELLEQYGKQKNTDDKFYNFTKEVSK